MHKGRLWEKVEELQLSERDLIESFDSEADFANYMDRKPKIQWDQVHGQEKKNLDSIREEARVANDEPENPKGKQGLKNLRAKADEANT